MKCETIIVMKMQPDLETLDNATVRTAEAIAVSAQSRYCSKTKNGETSKYGGPILGKGKFARSFPHLVKTT